MTLTHCPYCGTRVTFIRGGKRNRPIERLVYCTSCGWNIPVVKKGLASQWRRGSLLIFAFGVLVVTQILVLMMTAQEPVDRRGIAIVLGFAALWIFAAFFLPYRKYKNDLSGLMDLQRDIAARASAGKIHRDAMPTPDPEIVRLCDFIRSIPRPRPVRFNFWAQIAVYASRFFGGAYVLAALRTVISPYRSLSTSQNHLLAFGVLALGLVLWFAFPVAARHESRLDLLKDGEVALGRVLSPASPKVSYEFADGNGRVISGRGRNLTPPVQEGMYVPVFYDPQHPEDNIAMCSSWYEIVSPMADSQSRPWLTRLKPQ